MNNSLAALHLLLKNDSFHFDPKPCRSANVRLMEATLRVLRWLFIDEDSNVKVITYFGLGLAYKLLKQGYVENPLGDAADSQTNIWKLSDNGLEVLKTITGVKS